MVDELLLAAVKNHTVKVVEDLVNRHAANPKQVNRLGQTLLFEAAQHVSGQQALEISQFLIEHGVSATAADIRQQHACFYAAKHGHSQLCELLITQGCGVSQSDTARQTALFYSVRNGHIGATEVLLKHGAEIDARDQHGFTPIFWAAEAGKVPMMKRLVQAGATTNLLSDMGGDIFTSATGPAVKYAFEELRGDPKRMLPTGQTNLFGAAKRGDVEKLKVLVETHNVEVDHVDQHGQTCLFFAAAHGGLLVTNLLVVKYKADVLMKDNRGRTPRQYVQELQKPDLYKNVVKLLADAERKQQKAIQEAQKKQRAAAARLRKREEKLAKAQKKAEEQERARAERAAAAATRVAAASSSSRRRAPSPEEPTAKRQRYELACHEGRRRLPQDSEKFTAKWEELVDKCQFLQGSNGQR